MPIRILLDANVLMSRTLRDWILLIAVAEPGMFSVVTTEDILAEVVYRTRRRYPHVDGAVLARLRVTIVNSVFEVLASYPVVALDGLRDQDDLHLHSAAIAGEVGVLVTHDRDLLELSGRAAASLPYDVLDPDSFLILCDDSSPGAVSEVTRQQRAYWERRGRGETLIQALERAGCARFAARIRVRLLDGDDFQV